MNSNRIELDVSGAPATAVVRGTHISVAGVLAQLAEDGSIDGVIRNTPALSREDVQACLAYAGELLEEVEELGVSPAYLHPGRPQGE